MLIRIGISADDLTMQDYEDAYNGEKIIRYNDTFSRIGVQGMRSEQPFTLLKVNQKKLLLKKEWNGRIFDKNHVEQFSYPIGYDFSN